jgi:hypothetical protein
MAGGGGIVECICALGNTTAIIDAELDVRDLLNIYSGCAHMRPGDLHFPASGCTIMGTNLLSF